WVMPPRGHTLPHKPHLFKIGRENTGENWAEKVGCEIARALQLPCANYELAVSASERGVLSEIFLTKGTTLYLGNVLLANIVDGYDGAKRFKQIEYKLSRVVDLIQLLSKSVMLTPCQVLSRLCLRSQLETASVNNSCESAVRLPGERR